MNVIILSDLHIGSRYFFHRNFEQFLDHIPEDAEFILNGDIIDNPYAKLKPADQQLLDRFGEMSLRQKLVWVRGNHDNGYIPDRLGKIQIKKHYALQKTLFITHGDFFDEVMPQRRIFIKTFQMLHDLRIRLGARPVHVAQYAKRWKRFYAYLRKNVMVNAVNYAAENGFKAVTCGHTHYAEERFVHGIRYINTGAWTEQPAYCVHVTETEITLKKATDCFHPLRSDRHEKSQQSPAFNHIPAGFSS